MSNGAGTPGQTGRVPYFQKTVLENGIRVVTSTVPHAHSVSLAIYFGVGSRYEPDRIGGVSHFIEHMLFKGTARRPEARYISEAIEGLGGVLNAATSREYTMYYAKVASEHFRHALDVLTDMVLHSRFDPAEIEKERKVIIEEINMSLDSPSDLVGDLIEETIWGKQPLGRDVAGTEETVTAIGREDLLQYMHAHYVPGETVVAAAGNISHDEVVQEVEHSLGHLKPAERPGAVPARIEQYRSRARVHYKDTEQVNLCLGVPALPYTDPRRYAQNLMDTVLGEGMSSRLFLHIREEHGLAYSVHSYTPQYADVGAAIVYAGVDPERIDASIQAVLAELYKLRTIPISEEELHKAKEYSKGRMLLRLEDTSAVASWIGWQELHLRRVQTVEEVIHHLEAVTSEDIQAVAGEIYRDERLNLAVVGPYRDEEHFRSLLQLGDYLGPGPDGTIGS